MSLSQASVRRPVTTTMAVLIVVILGAVSFIKIPVELMPEITFPTVTVSTEYENVGPQEVERLISEPIEKAVSSVQGVEEVNSVSVEGRSQVRVSFTWGTDLDGAVSDIREKIDRIRDDLPQDAQAPVISKYDVNAAPIMFIGVSGDMDPVSLRTFVEDQIQYRLERLPGVASADIRGGLEREIHVNLFLDKLRALHLAPSDVIRALKTENVNLPAGHVDRGHLEVTVRTLGEFTDLDQIRNTAISVHAGTPVYVRYVAEVKDAYKEIDHVVWINGRNAVVISLLKQPLTNTVAVVDRVKDEIASINRDHPQIRIQALRDNATYIRRAITNVSTVLFWGGGLAILILLFFLRSFRSTLVIATAIPISVIATFALMYFQGFSINIMSFGGLALGIGMLVDNSIVVLENIFRHRERGAERAQAVFDGTREVSGAITASTLTTLVVFLPLLFIPGSAGILFKQLAWVVFFSLVASLLVALTIVPVMAYQLLAAPIARHRTGLVGRFFQTEGSLLARSDSAYQSFVSWAIDHKGAVWVFALALLGLSLTLLPMVGREFMPKADEGEVRIYAEMEEGAKIEAMEAAFRHLEALVQREVPEAENVFTHFGRFGFSARGKNEGHVHIWLGPRDARARSDQDIAKSLRHHVGAVPGVTARVRARGGLFVFRRLGLSGDDNLELHLRGYDLENGRRIAEEIKGRMERISGLSGVRVNVHGGQPEIGVQIDRARAASLGIPVETIAQALQTSLGGTQASLYREGGNEFDIRVRLHERFRRSANALRDFAIPTPSGKIVPLETLVRFEKRSGPMEIHRLNQERTLTVSGEVSGRDMGSVMQDVEASLNSLSLPDGFSILFGGDYREQQEAFGELRWGLLLAVVLVYMVMAAQFESLRDPVVIMVSIPFAAIGVVLVLFLTGTTLNVNSFIGMIMLTGIVVNNAIVLVDYINLKIREEGPSVREAVIIAGRTRLRPILMTTLTTILGMLPMALGAGEGGEVQAPLALVVIAGLTTSTLITLILIPVLYTQLKERKLPVRQSVWVRWGLANGRLLRK
jgi:HAE1 family hydrophobic/amphiphilic exporter-1